MNSAKWYQLISQRVMSCKAENCCIGSMHNRNYSTQKARKQSYYETLGLTRKATQVDIKTAYYKLSMQYHPDKNEGSDNAAQKFRDITEAYEVLGNFRRRKLYDKGIIHTVGYQYSQAPESVFDEDDAQTKFYKARMNKSTVPDASGRTPIYNFDEWSRAHYGSSFERRKEAKEKYDRNVAREKSFKYHLQTEYILILLALGMLGVGVVTRMQADLDVDKTEKRKQQS